MTENKRPGPHAQPGLHLTRAGAMSAVTMIFGLMAGNGVAAMEAGVRPATVSGQFGLYPASEFRLADGKCLDCPVEKSALWYFKEETIAVPIAGASGFERGAKAFDDVRKWAREKHPESAGTRPPLLWIGSPEIAAGATLEADAKTLRLTGGKTLPFALVPKIDANLSYFDASSLSHFAGRPLTIRGKTSDGKFIGRSLWPDDYALDFTRLSVQPLQSGESLDSLIRAGQGGARDPMSARVLWQRQPGAAQQWAGKPVLAFVLNGAQGDDDEAHGGHFAVATGRFGPRGEWGDWTVNNFYNLDSISEKGIVAASLPMDAYQGDLNSGQSWYRPSYLIVAVLKNERVAMRYQDAINRVFSHFYRHDFTYRHATANCAGLNMETLRTIGWQIPEQGPTSRLKAIAAMPFMSIKEGSLETGKQAVDYLMAERTNLYPMLAFQAAGNDLLTRLAQGRATTELEKNLAEDMEGLVFIRLPQFPSSRALGQAPVASIDEFMQRTPADRTQWKTVPNGPRPFPPELKDPQAPAEELPPSAFTLYGYGGVLGLAALGIVRRRWRKGSTASIIDQRRPR